MKRVTLKWYDWFLTAAAVIFLAAALCPFSVIKSAGDHFASDGELERLTPETGLFLRFSAAFLFIMFSGIVLWGMFAPGGRKSFFRSVASLPGRCVRDAGPFCRDLGRGFSPHGWRFWLMILVFAAGTVLRVIQAGRPLGHDEAYSMAIWARSDILFAISDYHLPNNHVFHSFLINLIYHYVGKSVWMLRLPVLISGCLLIPAVWLLGRKFYNDFIALTAAGLTAFAPYLVSYSVNARGYEIQALLSVLTLGLAVYGRRKRNIFAWFLFILLSALNFFTLPIALYPFGGICVWLFLNCIFFRSGESEFKNGAQLFKYLIFSGLSVSVLSLLLYVPLLRYSGWNSFFGNIYIGGVEKSLFTETMISRLTDNISEFIGTWPLPVIAAAAAGLVLSLFSFRKSSQERVSYGLALLLWMAAVIPFQKPNLWPRTLLFLHPFLFLFISSGLFVLRLIPGLGKAAGWICAAVVIAAGVEQFYAARNVPGMVGSDEQAVRLILEREKGNAENIHFVTAAQDNAPLWIYADIYGFPRKIFDKRETFNTVYAYVNPMNDSYLGPVTLDDLLARFGPGDNFIDQDSSEIIMEEPDGILYRFAGREGAIIKGYGEYPEMVTDSE